MLGRMIATCMLLVLGVAPCRAEGRWVELFNGRDLTGWKTNVAPESYRVEEGVLRVHNPSAKVRSHLFFVGDDAETLESFTDFELVAVCRAEPDSNSGVFFHTDYSERDTARHLGKGYEAQLNSGGGKRRTGSLYAIEDIAESVVDESKWFEMRLVVQGKRITVRLNGQTVVDYIEPENPERPENRKNRLLDPDGGAIAIQAHDANSIWYFKEIKVRRLDAKPVFVCDFESEDWLKEWGRDSIGPTVSTVSSDRSRKFEPLDGKAMRVQVRKGDFYGLSLTYPFKKMLGEEPEEVYFRYHIRLGDDWTVLHGGKMPGFGGTYGRAGWGGRPVKGELGWSARGHFNTVRDGLTPFGFYCYHADMKGKYGNVWPWEKDKGGWLERNRWYAIEQYCRMNTPGERDGVLRAWVDGRLAFEKTDIRMRTNPQLKIENVWMNVYHGGKTRAETDNHLFIDSVVISPDPIGVSIR